MLGSISSTTHDRFVAMSASERKSYLVRLFGDLAHSPSPTASVEVVTGYDSEGWEVWETFYVGNLLSAPSGNLWRIAGFNTDNTAIVSPHGLNHDEAIRAMSIRLDTGSIKVVEEGGFHTSTLSHKEGLVSFAA